MSSSTRVALLGLGTMGAGMAGCLLRAGFQLTVYNRNAVRAEALVKRGAIAATTPASAAANADVVIAMLADDRASREVWMGNSGALPAMKKGSVLVDCSTISPGWVRELGTLALKNGCELLDAPVTGSKPQAEAGELLFLVGGSATTLERVRPVLAAMSRDAILLGPTGSGALVKLINNFVCGAQAVAIGEALALIEKTDLDPVKALAVLTSGAPGSPLVKTISSRMTAHNYTPNFRLDLMMKDLSYAITVAAGHGQRLATAEAARQVMHNAVTAGHGQQDFSSLIEPLRKKKEPTP